MVAILQNRLLRQRVFKKIHVLSCLISCKYLLLIQHKFQMAGFNIFLRILYILHSNISQNDFKSFYSKSHNFVYSPCLTIFNCGNIATWHRFKSEMDKYKLSVSKVVLMDYQGCPYKIYYFTVD